MNTLDVAALLDKNPQVDRNIIDQQMRKAEKEGPRPTRRQGGNISPYGGRRLIVDERGELEAQAADLHRSVYGRR